MNERPWLNPMLSAECRLLHAVGEIGGLEKDLQELRDSVERPCCGTFRGTPHRSTCTQYRGKRSPQKKAVRAAAAIAQEMTDAQG